MAGQDNGRHLASTDACFLCALDIHPCAVPQLAGRILSAYERALDGETTPIIVLECGATRVELRLSFYYQDFIRALQERGRAIRGMTLRVYHLPFPPHITEHTGQSRHIYLANSYTLAVLEPDMLLNITDLNAADYCSRQYLLQQLVSSPPSSASIRGNLVHHCFRELLKEHDSARLLPGQQTSGAEDSLAILQRHFELALARSSIELALANISPASMRAEVAPHLESLATWYQRQSATLWDAPTTPTTTEPGQQFVRAETFLLAPEIGLRGRLDILWQQPNRRSLLELKTGGKEPLPRSNHRWQVQGYHALLAVRRESKMQKASGMLLYSGTPGEAQSFLITPTIRDLQRVNSARNILALSRLSSIPARPPGPSHCTKCAVLATCQQVSSLLDWEPPQTMPAGQPDDAPRHYAGGNPALPSLYRAPSLLQQQTWHEDDRAFFARYYTLLLVESRAAERQQALLWQTPVAERIERGTAIQGLQPIGRPQPTASGEWEQTFLCVNTSELREGDEILLSDGDPITGEVVTGAIQHISAEQVRVWTPETLARPALIDRYESNIINVRTMQNLLRWLRVDPRLRALVTGRIRPSFSTVPVAPRPDFNDEQNLAVARALQMQDYLLIQGPPGTGKTSVIAEIVKRLRAQGAKILLAAFTNQAVDNMLTRLEAEGCSDYIRLGHQRSAHAAVQEHLLQHQIARSGSIFAPVRELLATTPVVASTSATWSSDQYTLQAADNDEISPLQFDVAIIDEASQLTVPAILGALRFARRFILVGDEQQLPPLVLSQEAAHSGLSTSLFILLKAFDVDYMKEHALSTSACVSLRVQYRMNKWICNFASKVFYAGQLVAAPTVAEQVLSVPAHGCWTSSEAAIVTRAIAPAFPLVFLDVSGAAADEAAPRKSSNCEARMVRALVQGLLARDIAPHDIGIIALYRAQVANLRRHLFSDNAPTGWHALPATSTMCIDTVDRFQGGERLVIILSFATMHTPEADSPLREFLSNPNRLNVALTRAQRKLILVGCAPALETLPYLQRLLTYCRSMKTLLSLAPTTIF